MKEKVYGDGQSGPLGPSASLESILTEMDGVLADVKKERDKLEAVAQEKFCLMCRGGRADSGARAHMPGVYGERKAIQQRGRRRAAVRRG